MKNLLFGFVILRFNKASMKLSHWWRRGKLNLSPPVTRIIPLSVLHKNAETRPTIQPESLLMKAGSNYLHLALRPQKVPLREHRDEISGPFVSTSLTENKHLGLSATHESCHQYGPLERGRVQRRLAQHC